MPSGSWTATTSLAAVHHRPVRDAEGIQVGQPGVHFGVARDRLVWPPACWRSLSSCDLTCRLWFGCEDGLCGIMSFDQEQPDPNKGRDEQSRRPSPRRSHRAVVAVSPRVLPEPDPAGGCVVCAGRGGAVRRWTSKDAGGSVADPPRLDRTQDPRCPGRRPVDPAGHRPRTPSSASPGRSPAICADHGNDPPHPVGSPSPGPARVPELRAKTTCPAGAPKPGKPGPRRPPRSTNRRPPPHHHVGKTIKRPTTLAARFRQAAQTPSSGVVAFCRHSSTSDGPVTPGQPVTAPT